MPITVVAAEPIDGHVRRDMAIVSSLGEHTVGRYVLVRVGDEDGRAGDENDRAGDENGPAGDENGRADGETALTFDVVIVVAG